jgi:branched-subunit amino acid transport protein
VSTDLVALAALMWAVTYPARGAGLLNPAIERMPRRALDYLQLVGPAVLAALAAVNTVVVTPAGGRPGLVFGIPLVAVAVCLALVARFRSLFVGLVAAVIIAVVGRAAGLP